MARGNMRKDAKEQLKYQEELQKYENDLKMVEYTINKLNLKKQELLIQIHNLKKQTANLWISLFSKNHDT